MTIHDIYAIARERDLARSLRQFSRDLLGRAPNYAADTGLDRCSASALLNLHRRLSGLGHPDLAAAAFKLLLAAEARSHARSEVPS
jgi:hypothetical protein